MATVNTIKGNPYSSMITKHDEFILAERIPCCRFFRTQFIENSSIYLQVNLLFSIVSPFLVFCLGTLFNGFIFIPTLTTDIPVTAIATFGLAS